MSTDVVTELRQMAAAGYAGWPLAVRAADEIERQQGELDRLDKKCSALALLAYGEIQAIDSPSAICAIIGCKEREEHLHYIAHPPERSPADVSDDGKCWIKGCQQPKGHAGFCDPLPDPRKD